MHLVSSCVALRLFATAVMSTLFIACVEDPPVGALPPNDSNPLHGVIVVNEGLWYQDNSSLTLYDPVERMEVQDWFARRNPNERLGDTGNGIVVRNGTAYVVVTTSQNVEAISIPSGRSRGRARIGDGNPRKVVIVNDSIAYVTLVTADAIIRFDPRTLAVGARTSVGPAPEGIAAYRGHVFVANSGYGLLRRAEPKAGTVSVIGAFSGDEIALLSPGPNPVAVHADSASGIVYVQYGMPHADSAGGVVAYDAMTLRELTRWPVKGAGVAGEMALDPLRRRLYVVDGTGTIVRIDVSSALPAEQFLSEVAPTPLGFYGIGVSPLDGTIYASYVTSYSLPGSVIVFELDGTRRDLFDAGLNPGAFGFY